VEVATYVLSAGAICLAIVVVLGGLLVGLNTAFTLALRRRGLIDDDRTDRLLRIRAVTLTVLGLLCLLTPVRGMVAGDALVAAGAGALAAGALMTAAGVVGHSFLSQRIERRRLGIGVQRRRR
jgi:hypothetical protein